jgi:hypothetical protein
MWRNTPVAHQPEDDARSHTSKDAGTATADEEAEARLFYERLEQTGRLVDVSNNTDLATLDPRITHIRRPDGSIERIGFA